MEDTCRKNVTGTERNLGAVSVICWSGKIQTQRLLSFADDGFGKFTLHVCPLWRVEDYKTSQRGGRRKNWHRWYVLRMKKNGKCREREGGDAFHTTRKRTIIHVHKNEQGKTRGVSFFDYHIYHHPLRPVKTDSANVEILTAKEVAVWGTYWCICRRCWASFSSFPVYSKPPGSFVTYFPAKTKKSTFVLQLRKVPRVTFRNCKTI